MDSFLETIRQPWPWYVAGFLIGLIVPTLLLMGNKKFGISSNFRHICAACFPGKISFFQYDWKKEAWNLFFVAGMFVGGFIASRFLTNDAPIGISQETINDLKLLGINSFNSLMPDDIFSWSNLFTLKGLIFFIVGGFLVGFGTRYAGGCTSGHAIMGLSNLQWPSLIATICFMIGGIVMTHFLLPLLLRL